MSSSIFPKTKDQRIKALMHLIEGWENQDKHELIEEILPMLSADQIAKIYEQQIGFFGTDTLTP